MKTFKWILFTLMNILSIPLSAIVALGACWYTLPMMKTTIIGTSILKVLTEPALFWITISSGVLLAIFFILSKIFDRNSKAKFKNFFVHFDTWFIAIAAIALSTATFILAEIEVTTFELSTTRKIGIGVSFVLLFISVICAGKISKVINRRIQAYENAKELNVVGRGSIFWTNFLKVIEILFPEVIGLVLICFCLSWNVATYFIVILASFTIPMLGNIDADLNTRMEIKRNLDKKDKEFVDKVAQKVKGE